MAFKPARSNKPLLKYGGRWCRSQGQSHRVVHSYYTRKRLSFYRSLLATHLSLKYFQISILKKFSFRQIGIPENE